MQVTYNLHTSMQHHMVTCMLLLIASDLYQVADAAAMGRDTEQVAAGL
jgi:hypothetical protein